MKPTGLLPTKIGPVDRVNETFVGFPDDSNLLIRQLQLLKAFNETLTVTAKAKCREQN